MAHNHVGGPDKACDGCIKEANAGERRDLTIALVIWIALVIGCMALLSWYLSKHGSHIG